MRSHLIIKLFTPLKGVKVPYWVEFINDKEGSISFFNNAIDEILSGDNLQVWITTEYKPASGEFSKEEISSGLNRIYRVILQNMLDFPESVIKKIRGLPIVEEVRDAILGEAYIPNKISARHLSITSDKARENIHLKEAQFYSKGNPNIRIAILDTGIDTKHREIKDSIIKMADFVNLEGLDTTEFVGDTLGYDSAPDDEVGHGTGVAGQIAGKGLRMPEGIVPNCKILVVRVLAAMKQNDRLVGAGLIDNINTGIKWSVDNGADIINMSLGVKHEYGGLPHQEVINYALNKGVTIVAASGNDGNNDKYYPGALPGVIAVGAVDENDDVTSFSNYGSFVSLVAPGTNIYSSYINESYFFSSGTSQAAPFVTGGVALLKSYAYENGYDLTDGQVKNILKNTSDKPGSSFKTEKTGYGRINLLDAVRFLKYQLNSK